MIFEGTALYFWLIILILFLTYIIKKVSLIFIFKKARIKGMNALIPFKYRIDLTDAINLNRSVAYMAYIPVYGIKYRKIIIETLLQGLGLNKNSVILAEQIRTIDKSRLKEKIGHIDGNIMEKVNNALGVSFGL